MYFSEWFEVGRGPSPPHPVEDGHLVQHCLILVIYN